MINYHLLCKCHKCHKSFISESGLKRHELQHSSMDYKCTVYNREFAFESELNSHKTNHSKEKHFKCQYPRCNRAYKTKAEYWRHYKTHGRTSNDHRCPVCNKTFNKCKYLREHKQVHTGELPFACSTMWRLVQMEKWEV